MGSLQIFVKLYYQRFQDNKLTSLVILFLEWSAGHGCCMKPLIVVHYPLHSILKIKILLMTKFFFHFFYFMILVSLTFFLLKSNKRKTP